MKNPIFAEISSKLREELEFRDNGLQEIERRMVDIIAQNKDALVTAWVAETGNLPSESVICHGFRDGHARIWVETKDENDRMAKRAI